MFDLICLLYPDTDTDTVDTWLNEDLLIFVAGDVQRVQQELGRASGFDFGDIVSFRGLGGKVGDGQRSSEGRAHALKIWPQGLGLVEVSRIARVLMERGPTMMKAGTC